MKERMPGNSDLWAGYEGENNIFPASFIVTLTDLNKNESVLTEIERIGAHIATEGRSKEVDLEIDETTIHDSLIKEIRNANFKISPIKINNENSPETEHAGAYAYTGTADEYAFSFGILLQI